MLIVLVIINLRCPNLNLFLENQTKIVSFWRLFDQKKDEYFSLKLEVLPESRSLSNFSFHYPIKICNSIKNQSMNVKKFLDTGFVAL